MNLETNSKKKNPKKKKLFLNLGYDFTKITGAPSALLWLRPKRLYPEGKPDLHGALMISSNHKTFWDPIILLCAFWNRRVFSLATKDLYEHKGMPTLFKLVRCIQTDKENFSISAFHSVVERLKMGEAILIFPEGQINESSTNVLTFKSGAVLMAHQGGAPILPVYIVPRKKWYQRHVVVIGQKIDVAAELGDRPTLAQLSEMSERLRKSELALAEYYEARMKNKKQKNIKEKYL